MAAILISSAKSSFDGIIQSDYKNSCTTEQPEILEEKVEEIISDKWFYPYTVGEYFWGLVLVIGIFGINIWVLWVIARSKILWKPRHLWMAALCVTDLFVGCHKVIELTLLIFPSLSNAVCVINKSTLGIPYILNMFVLTLLSVDRFVAVTYPFFYSSIASNKHVGIGFLLVLLAGCILSGASIAVGLNDVVCRVHCLQLKYLIITLTICSILTLGFNFCVLRTAKKQLTAIYGQKTNIDTKNISVFCEKCGHKNQTFVTTIVTKPISSQEQPLLPLQAFEESNSQPCLLKIEENESSCFPNMLQNYHLKLSAEDAIENSYSADDLNITFLRTASAPSFAMVNNPLDTNYTNKDGYDEIRGDTAVSPYMAPIQNNILPRSKSLEHENSNRTLVSSAGTRKQLFRNLHLAHMFHMRRLFPSIRFARTVLLIMIPMWIFILPVITIIPLHRSCKDGTTQTGCSTVESLWTYLLVHIRSILPLQAILDTLIYSCGSKEFRSVLTTIFKSK